MIWALDVAGNVQYAGPEWTRLTGQDLEAAGGRGWLSVVHPEDRQVVDDVLAHAVEATLPFCIVFRIKTVDPAGVLWVASGGEPRFTGDGRFLGFVGATSEALGEQPEAARGRVGRYRALPAGPATKPSVAIDIITDHLILAHSLAQEAGDGALVEALRPALFEVGVRIASSQKH